MGSNVSSVTNLLPRANEGFSSTLAATISASATTVPLTSTTGLTDGTFAVLVVEPKNAKEQVVTGKVHVASSSLVNCVWTKGSNVVHTAGVTVVDYVTGTHLNMLSRHASIEHKDTGAHKAITADSLVTTGSISTAGGLSVTGGGVTLPAASIAAASLGVAVTASTNAGTAGGSLNYTTIGGLKQAWGTTALQGIAAGGTPLLTVTLPASFFGTAPQGMAIAVGHTGGGFGEAYLYTATTSTASITFYNRNTTGTSTYKAMWWLIGS